MSDVLIRQVWLISGRCRRCHWAGAVYPTPEDISDANDMSSQVCQCAPAVYDKSVLTNKLIFMQTRLCRKITVNLSVRTDSWNRLPSSFRQPHSVHCPPGSPHPAHVTLSQSSSSFSPSVTPSTFHSRLKTHLFHKSFPPQSLVFLPDCLHIFWTCIELKGYRRLFILVSSFIYFFCLTCSRLSWILSFRVHVKLFNIVSYRINFNRLL